LKCIGQIIQQNVLKELININVLQKFIQS